MNARGLEVHQPEVELSVGMPLVGGALIPLLGFDRIHIHAATLLVHQRHEELRVGVLAPARGVQDSIAAW